METFLAILVLTTLALLASSPMFLRLRRSRALSILMTGGWLAMLTGVILGPSGVAIISESALRNSTPLLMMGLGWIGFMIGLQARADVLRAVVGETWRVVTLDAILTLVVIGTASWFVLTHWIDPGGVAWLFMPIALIVAASFGWSIETRSLRRERSPDGERRAMLLRASGSLAAIVAIAWFGVWYEIPIRDEAGDMTLDWSHGALKIFAATVAAFVAGVFGRFAFRMAGRNREQQLVISLGLVVFIAGLATAITASPLFAAMLTGVVIANLAGKEFQRFERFIIEAEHVVAIIFALLAGALLDLRIGLWGAVLAGVIIVARIGVKPLVFRLGVRTAEQQSAPSAEARRVGIAGPMRQHPIAIALAIGVVLVEPSPFNKRLMTTLVAAGLMLDMAPVLLAVLHSLRPTSTEGASA